jgi:hypothetical protein
MVKVQGPAELGALAYAIEVEGVFVEVAAAVFAET